ncbi:MAG: metallophosphoesterase family protein [Anaerolineae bacterium]
MARIVIFSDLHANREALLALQRAEPRPDAVLCLGDTVGYGPEPKHCLDAVRRGATHLIGGRHDRAVGDARLSSPNSLLEATWAYTRSILPPADRSYLAALPAAHTVTLAGVRFHLARLAPDDDDVETQMLITMSQARLKERFGALKADIILLGGPHIPAMRQIGDRLIVCPGSLGQPRYGVSDPTFAAWEDGRLQIHHLHYHPQDTIRKLSLLPLDPEHILRLQSILQTGKPE